MEKNTLDKMHVCLSVCFLVSKQILFTKSKRLEVFLWNFLFRSDVFSLKMVAIDFDKIISFWKAFYFMPINRLLITKMLFFYQLSKTISLILILFTFWSMTIIFHIIKLIIYYVLSLNLINNPLINNSCINLNWRKKY